MPEYKYRAIDGEGRPVRGLLQATNLAELEQRLARQGLDLLRATPSLSGLVHLQGRKVGRRELIHFCFHLQQLVAAGVPLLDGLRDLAESLEQAELRRVAQTVIDAIEAGKSLSEALAEHPRVFGEVFVSLVRAGEHSGRLAEVLDDLAAQLRWEDELAAQSRRLALYPLFVATVVASVTVFLLVHLVPQMAGLIRNLGQELPVQTRLLLWSSDFLVRHGGILLGLLAAPAVALALLARRDARVQESLDRVRLSLPVLGPVLKKIALSRFASSFALLYASGITVLEALRQCEAIVGNRLLRQAIRRAGEAVAEGKTLAAALGDTGLFPALVIRMLRIGEQTGRIDTSLRNVNYFYNREVREAVGVLQALIEPVLTVALGAVLAAVMLAVLGPVYDTMTALKW